MFCFPINLILFFYEVRKLRQGHLEHLSETQTQNDEEYARYLQEIENQNNESFNPEQFEQQIPQEVEERESLISSQELAYQQSLQRDLQRENEKRQKEEQEKRQKEEQERLKIENELRKEKAREKFQNQINISKETQIKVVFKNKEERIERIFSLEDRVQDLFDYIDVNNNMEYGKFQLVTNFPTRRITTDQSQIKLKDYNFDKVQLFHIAEI